MVAIGLFCVAGGLALVGLGLRSCLRAPTPLAPSSVLNFVVNVLAGDAVGIGAFLVLIGVGALVDSVMGH